MVYKWNAAEVAAITGAGLPSGLAPDLIFDNVFTDSRKVAAGGLFVPLKGERFNAHDFVSGVLRGGASASLWSDSEAAGIEPPLGFEDRLFKVRSVIDAYLLLGRDNLRRCGAKVVGVTGSVGKTTAKDFIKAIFAQKYCCCGTAANHNNEVGMAETLLSVCPEHDFVVAEMGMRGRGEIRRLADLTVPEICVITTIGESHLERLGSREEIALAKAELLDSSAADSVAVLPADSDFFELLREHARGRVVSFGLASEHADWRLLNSTEKASVTEPEEGSRMRKVVWGQEVSFLSPDGEYLCFLPVPGRHNCSNMLAAVAAGHAAGVSVEQAAAGLRSCVMTGRRLQIEMAPDGTILIDDSYNAAPSSVRAALELLGRFPSVSQDGRVLGDDGTKHFKRIAVLGDMLELGSREAVMHEQIGAFCADCGIDLLIGVGDLSVGMVKAAKKCGVEAVWSAEYSRAFERLAELYAPGDHILVKASHSIELDRLAAEFRKLYNE